MIPGGSLWAAARPRPGWTWAPRTGWSRRGSTGSNCRWRYGRTTEEDVKNLTVQNGDRWTERERGQLEFDDDDKKEGRKEHKLGFKEQTRRDKPFCQANSIIIHPERRRLNKKRRRRERDPRKGWTRKTEERMRRVITIPCGEEDWVREEEVLFVVELWTCQKITNFVCRSCKDFVFHLEIVCHKMMIILRCEKKERIPRPEEEEGKEGRRRKTEVITPTIRMWRREDSGPPKGSDGGTRAHPLHHNIIIMVHNYFHGYV